MPLLRLGYKAIHYTDFPAASSASQRETFIFTHGLGSSQNYYTAIIPAFTSKNIRCIAFDTTGSARSPYTQVEQSVASLAGDIIALMDSLSPRVEKAVLVGHSMGAIVAAHLAATHSGRIAASCWIGPVYPSPAVRELFMERIAAVEEEGAMDGMANSIPAAATGSHASPLAKAFIRELLLSQDPAGYVSNCRVIANAEPPEYGEVKCPVLLIAGEEDKSAPLDSCEQIFRKIGTQEKWMEVLRGVGHWHCLEAPQEVAKEILDFYYSIQ